MRPDAAFPAPTRFLVVPFLVACCLAACGPNEEPAPGERPPDDAAASKPVAAPRCATHDPLRNVWFGDLHVHTGLSADAFATDTRITLDEAYAFARGEEIRLAPLDVEGRGTRPTRSACSIASPCERTSRRFPPSSCLLRGPWRSSVHLVN